MSQDVSVRESRRSDLLPGTAYQRWRALDAAWLRWHRQGNLYIESCVFVVTLGQTKAYRNDRG